MRYDLPTVKRLCKKYNYGLTQEGESFIISVKGMRYTFSSSIQMINWFKYHDTLDRNSK